MEAVQRCLRALKEHLEKVPNNHDPYVAQQVGWMLGLTESVKAGSGRVEEQK